VVAVSDIFSQVCEPDILLYSSFSADETHQEVALFSKYFFLASNTA